MRRRRELKKIKSRSLKTSKDYFKDSVRYYRNAKKVLKEAKVKYDLYEDLKPVREACGVGYLAIMLVLDGYFISRGVDNRELPESIDGYWEFFNRFLTHNGKLKGALTIVYENIHIAGYYRGVHDSRIVKSGFEKIKEIIETLSGQKL